MGFMLPCREQPTAQHSSQLASARHVQTLVAVPRRWFVDPTHDSGLCNNGTRRGRAARPHVIWTLSGRGKAPSVVRATSTPSVDVGEKRTGPGDTHMGTLRPLPKHLVLDNPADDPSLGNPLQRHKRMGMDWMGVILDYEGGLVEDTTKLHTEAWLTLAEEEGKPPPLRHTLKRAALMKAEQAIAEVLCWGRDPSYVRRLAERREEIYRNLLGEWRPAEVPGVRDLLETLKTHEVPVAVCSTSKFVHDDIKCLGLEPYISEVLSADDVERCRPDPTAYIYAAQRINRPSVRCIVLGASNMSCEAAHDCGMQCVAVAGQQPLFELTAADLVVKQLDELSFVNFKQLFTLEEGIEPQVELEEDPEAAPEGLWL